MSYESLRNAFERLQEELDDATFLDLLDLNRDEKAHTRFVGWLLSSDEGHGLRARAAELLLRMARDRCHGRWPNRVCMERCHILQSSVEFEKQIRIPDTHYIGYIDALLRLEIRDEETGETFWQVVIIENKVESEEHTIGQHAAGPMQTIAYRDWGDVEFQEPIYIFLTPLGTAAACDQFVNISYQNFVDLVLDPLVPSVCPEHRRMVVEYIKTLGYSNKKGRESPMAIGSDEREMYRRFWDENRDSILTLLSIISEDQEANMPDEARQQIARLQGNRRHSCYRILIDGVVQEGCANLSMGGAALRTIQLYVEMHPDVSLQNLVVAFPRAFNGHYEVLVADDENRRANLYPDNRLVELANGERAYVTNQWYADLWQRFIDGARGLGIDIESM